MRVDRISFSKRTGDFLPQNLPKKANLQKGNNEALLYIKDSSVLPSNPLYFTAQIINLHKHVEEQKSMHPISTDAFDDEINSALKERCLQKAASIKQVAPLILKESVPIYDNAKRMINHFNNISNLDIAPSNIVKEDNVLAEVDPSGCVLKLAFFKNGSLYSVKDFENSTVVICKKENLEEGVPEKIYVYRDCKDMKRPDIVSAKDSFVFVKKWLYRYSKECVRDISANSFHADETYTFKWGDIESYDKSLAIASGAEYSGEFYGFNSMYGLNPSEAGNNFGLFRYVKNKIATNGYIIFSTDEILFRK